MCTYCVSVPTLPKFAQLYRNLHVEITGLRKHLGSIHMQEDVSTKFGSLHLSHDSTLTVKTFTLGDGCPLTTLSLIFLGCLRII